LAFGAKLCKTPDDTLALRRRRVATEPKVKEQYDRLAVSYDQRWRTYLSGTLPFLKGWMNLSGDEEVLDVACGTGELERLLVTDFPALRVTGVDLSGNMLGVARDKLAAYESVDFRQGRAEELPFLAESFDMVVTANSFHYFDDPLVSLNEMGRVLRPGGRAMVLDWCRDFLVCRICDTMLKVLDPTYKQCYSQQELAEMMSSAELGVIAEHRFRPRIVWGMMVATGLKPRE